MPGLSSRLAAAHSFLAKLWKLSAPYFWSEERWSARGLLAIVVGTWNAGFFSALQDKNVEAFRAELPGGSSAPGGISCATTSG